MKNNNKIIIIFLIFGITVFTSCKKPKSPTATITVLNYAKEPVEEAIVTVYSVEQNGHIDPEHKILDTSNVTDENGKVTFEFKYEAILNVKAEKAISSKISLEGEGAIILTEDENYEETIIIR